MTEENHNGIGIERGQNPNQAKKTSQEFRDELKRALDKYYSDWSSEDDKQETGVAHRTLKRWVTGESRPTTRSLKAFLKAVKFPLEIEDRLWTLYHQQATPPPKTDHLLQWVYTTIDIFTSTLIQQGNAQNALRALKMMEESINAKANVPASVRAYLRVIEIEINRRLGHSYATTQLAHAARYVQGRKDFDLNLLAFYHHVEGLRLCWVAGDYKVAGTHFEMAVKYYEKTDAELEKHGVLCDQGMNDWCMGKLHSAMECLQTVYRYARDSNNNPLLLVTQGNLALIYLSEGDLNTARGCVEKQIELAADHPFEYARARGNRGIIRYYQGAYQDALSDLDADIAYYAEQGQTNGYGLAYAYAVKSLCLRALGDHEGARAAAQEALRIADKGFESIRVVALRAAAACAPDDATARQLLERARKLAAGKLLMHEAGICHSLAALMDDQADRTALYEHALNRLEEAGAHLWHQRLEFDQCTELPLV